jgi:hypothetical protein
MQTEKIADKTSTALRALGMYSSYVRRVMSLLSVDPPSLVIATLFHDGLVTRFNVTRIACFGICGLFLDRSLVGLLELRERRV